MARELEVMLLCARAKLSDADRDRLNELLAAGIDWGDLLHRARHHRLLPLVVHHLNAVATTRGDRDAIEPARAEQRLILARNMRLAAELRRLTELLRGAGIDSLSFKGPVLALEAYESLALRAFVDADLLIDAEHVERAHEILSGEHYTPFFVLSPPWRERHRQRYHEMAYFHEDGVAAVDIHWRLIEPEYSFARPLEHVEARRRSVDLDGVAISTLSREDQLFFLCLHAAKHQWKHLQWTADVAELARRDHTTDWPAFADMAASAGAARMVGVTFELARRLLGLPLHAAMAAMIDRDEAIAPLARRVESSLVAARPTLPKGHAPPWRTFYYQSMASRRDRAWRVYDTLVRPTALEWRMAPLPRVLEPVHFLLRPARLATRAVARLLARGETS